MFKKAFLSTLVSVFLTLSIFTVATAFGATTPTGNPPNGLASPTFGGVTVNGDSNFKGNISNSLGDLLINDDLNLNGRLFMNGGAIFNRSEDPVVIMGGLSLYGEISNPDPTISDGKFLINDPEGLSVNGPLFVKGHIYSSETGIDKRIYLDDTVVIAGSIINTSTNLGGKVSLSDVDGIAIDGTITNAGNSHNAGKVVISDANGISITGPTNISGATSVTGKVTATSIGTYRIQTPLTYRTLLADGWDNSKVTCNSNEKIISCGLNAYSDSAGVSLANAVSTGRTTIDLTDNSCTVAAHNNYTATKYWRPYALCFNPTI